MRTTNYMIGKWTKAALLVIFGIILLIYFEKVMDELTSALELRIGEETPFLIDLIEAIGWILILWCFVDAALNVLMSFRASKVSLDDIETKLDAIWIEVYLDKISKQQGTSNTSTKPIVVAQGNIGRVAAPAANKRLSPPMPPPPP